MTLPLWCLLEEALMDSDFAADPQGTRFNIAKAVYAELVVVLRRKCVWPKAADLSYWALGEFGQFQDVRSLMLYILTWIITRPKRKVFCVNHDRLLAFTCTNHQFIRIGIGEMWGTR